MSLKTNKKSDDLGSVVSEVSDLAGDMKKTVDYLKGYAERSSAGSMFSGNPSDNSEYKRLAETMQCFIDKTDDIEKKYTLMSRLVSGRVG